MPKRKDTDNQMVEPEPLIQETYKPKNKKDAIHLKRQLGLITCISYIVGTVIGTGIFVSPKGILQESGSIGLALILWAVSGVISLIGALCFAELGLTIPESGGSYTYIYRAYGDLAGFVFIWLEQFVRQPASQALRSLSVGYYLAQPIFPTCDPPYFATRLIGAAVFCFITFINCVKVKCGSAFQVVTTIAKLLALLCIIIAGFYAMANGGDKKFEDSFAGTKGDLGGIVMSIYYGLFAYAGWEGMNYATEEITNVKRTLPLSIIVGVLMVLVIYIFVNIAYLAVLTPQELISVDAVAVTFSMRLIPAAQYIVPVCVALSIIGSLNASTLTCSRSYYVGARNGHLPMAFDMIHMKRLTPLPALVLNCFLTLLLLCSPSLSSLLDYYVLIRWGLITVTTTTLVYLRFKQPNLHRPMKLPLVVPVVFLCVCIFLICVSFYREPYNCLISIALGAVGIPMYFILIKVTRKPKVIQKINENVTILCQKLFMCVAAERDPNWEEECS